MESNLTLGSISTINARSLLSPMQLSGENVIVKRQTVTSNNKVSGISQSLKGQGQITDATSIYQYESLSLNKNLGEWKALPRQINLFRRIGSNRYQFCKCKANNSQIHMLWQKDI